jgi:hypothetical protein
MIVPQNPRKTANWASRQILPSPTLLAVTPSLNRLHAPSCAYHQLHVAIAKLIISTRVKTDTLTKKRKYFFFEKKK